MNESILGIAIQTIIWMCIIYIVYDVNNIYESPDSIILLVLLILLYIYFYELLYKSKIFNLLYRKPIKINTNMDILKFLSLSNPYLLIKSSAFHLNNQSKNEIKEVTYKSKDFIEFHNIKDYTNIQSTPLFSNSILTSKLILIDISLFIRFPSNQVSNEIDSIIEKLKNCVSTKDKFYDCKTKFVFRHLTEKDNYFIFHKNDISFKKYIMIILYLLLIGEFYKLYLNSFIYNCHIDLVKEINFMSHPFGKDTVGRIISNKEFNYSKDIENIDFTDEIISIKKDTSSTISNIITKNYLDQNDKLPEKKKIIYMKDENLGLNKGNYKEFNKEGVVRKNILMNKSKEIDNPLQLKVEDLKKSIKENNEIFSVEDDIKKNISLLNSKIDNSMNQSINIVQSSNSNYNTFSSYNKNNLFLEKFTSFEENENKVNLRNTTQFPPSTFRKKEDSEKKDSDDDFSSDIRKEMFDLFDNTLHSKNYKVKIKKKNIDKVNKK